MGKRIALFIDGSWNREDAPRHSTNVSKLHLAVRANSGACRLEDGVPIAKPGCDQVVHYMRGVGTGGWFDRRIAGVTGFGTAKRIKEAYLFLARNYDPGDSVYLFGFSRGAFAARALAGFVAKVGLLFEGEASKRNVAKAYALYEEWSFDQQYFIDKISRRLEIPRGAVADVAPIPIHFIGVWDTVKRLGLEKGSLEVGQEAYHDRPSLPPHITHARHALALHDLRPEFEPTLWEDWDRGPGRQSLKQEWFRGAHADVGGGYLITELSEITLDWMTGEATHLGLNCGTRQPSGSKQSTFASDTVHYAHLPHWAKRFVESLKPREILSTWAAPTKHHLADSFAVHDSAVERLTADLHTHFIVDPDDDNDRPDAAGRIASEYEPVLETVDHLTLKMHLALSSRAAARGE